MTTNQIVPPLLKWPIEKFLVQHDLDVTLSVKDQALLKKFLATIDP